MATEAGVPRLFLLFQKNIQNIVIILYNQIENITISDKGGGIYETRRFDCARYI